ncbi:MAG: hypothetical protein KGR47_05400 [Acidobacteria bacterium]|nr:hypothetical protein [Acidobacteriota bacterium]
MTRTSTVTVRAATDADVEQIHQIFLGTMVMGRSAECSIDLLTQYADLCLGWYLGPGLGDAAVAVDPALGVVGYALVCSDPEDHGRWVRRRSLALAWAVTRRWGTRRLSPASRTFYGSRVRDLRALRSAAGDAPSPVHAHLNVRAAGRTGSIALALRDHIDRRCDAAGADLWWAEMNAVDGHRQRALERIGMEVLDRVHNETLSRLTGQPVVRLRVVRRLRV